MDYEDLNRQFHTCMPLFIALGDEVRLTIIETLMREQLTQSHGLNVKEITERINLSRPGISHHLKLLKDSGLINVRKEGTSNFYYLTLHKGIYELMNLGEALKQILNNRI